VTREALIVRGERVALPEGVRAASIHITDGRIAAIGNHHDLVSGVRIIDAGPLIVLPGLVDTHVHINDPGRTEWEGIETATRAAAAGGVTTVVDMPLNCIPATTTDAALEAKILATKERSYVDLGFWGGVVPGNTHELEPLAESGVLGVKCFLAPSGVDEFEHVTETDLREALPVLRRLGVPLLVHAELPALLCQPDSNADRRAYATWLESRPPSCEHEAIRLLINLADEFATHIHVVHLASSGALADLAAARRKGIRITAETCPHYLTFAAEDIPPGATPFKCAPPIREGIHRDELWNALLRGDIDLIATDHSPAPPAMKRLDDGDFMAAWGGIASLQLGLAAVWNGAVSRGIPLDSVVRWMADAPARLAGLVTKGAIAVGRDADLVLWDADAESTVDPPSLFHRHPVTPYSGMRLRGRVHTTIVRGEVVFHEDSFVAEPSGQHLLRRRPGGVRLTL
jgi:allantoinase